MDGTGRRRRQNPVRSRDEAAALRTRVRRGFDPLAEREATTAAGRPKTKAPTFAECAEKYIEAHRPGWKNEKHADQWQSTISTYANPVLGRMPVDTIGVDDVLKVLSPIWTEKPEPPAVSGAGSRRCWAGPPR